MSNKIFKDVVYVVVDMQSVSSGSFHKAVEHGVWAGAFCRAGSYPILAAYSEGTDRLLAGLSTYEDNWQNAAARPSWPGER